MAFAFRDLRKMGWTHVHEKISATTYFLNGKTDVWSSYYLEDPATEFDIQGLELDWAGICWDADFRALEGNWHHHQFRGTAWQNANNSLQKVFLTNDTRTCR